MVVFKMCTGMLDYLIFSIILRALTTAQLASQLREMKNLDQQVEKGDFNELIEWLKLNIYPKASLYSTNEILQQVTNSELNAKYFMDYIKIVISK